MKQTFDPGRRDVEKNEAAIELAKKPKAVLKALLRRIEDLSEKATRGSSGSVMSSSQNAVTQVASEEIINWIDEVQDEGLRLLKEAP